MKPPFVLPVLPLGNHVVVELAPEAFLLLAPLQQGSIRVEPGDRVGPCPIGRSGD